MRSVDLTAVYGSSPVMLVCVMSKLTVDEYLNGWIKENPTAKTKPAKAQSAIKRQEFRKMRKRIELIV